VSFHYGHYGHDAVVASQSRAESDVLSVGRPVSDESAMIAYFHSVSHEAMRAATILWSFASSSSVFSSSLSPVSVSASLVSGGEVMVFDSTSSSSSSSSSSALMMTSSLSKAFFEIGVLMSVLR
jgi:hypothetical protein|tara:strand:- start:397 stop:768 length:372 start_codon:yes stop_codon:yes gene_type:complete